MDAAFPIRRKVIALIGLGGVSAERNEPPLLRNVFEQTFA